MGAPHTSLSLSLAQQISRLASRAVLVTLALAPALRPRRIFFSAFLHLFLALLLGPPLPPPPRRLLTLLVLLHLLLLVVVHLLFLPLVSRAVTRARYRLPSAYYTEGLGRRRGRYFHLESPARPPHTHMNTRAHGNTPPGGRERTRGRRGSVGRTGGRGGGREGGGEVTEVIARRGTSVPRNCSRAFFTEPPTRKGKGGRKGWRDDCSLSRARSLLPRSPSQGGPLLAPRRERGGEGRRDRALAGAREYRRTRRGTVRGEGKGGLIPVGL